MNEQGNRTDRPALGRQRMALWSQMFLLALLLTGVIIASAGLGYIKIPFADVVRAVLSRISGNTGILGDMDRLFPVVVVDVRLPRILTSAIVGAGLAISGAVFQGILLNPLADPYTLGVSARGFKRIP